MDVNGGFVSDFGCNILSSKKASREKKSCKQYVRSSTIRVDVVVHTYQSLNIGIFFSEILKEEKVIWILRPGVYTEIQAGSI